MTDRELMQQALRYIESVGEMDNYPEDWAIALALRERLAQPEPEPVAWRITDGEGGYDYRTELPEDWSIQWSARYGRKYEPLYTAPRRRQRLTEEEIARRESVKPILVRIMQEAYDLADRDDSEGYNSVKVMCSEVLGMINELLDERQWQGLTDEDLDIRALWDILADMNSADGSIVVKFARAIEAKLKEKNT